MPTPEQPDDLADDLMTGIPEVSTFLGWPPRRTYEWAQKGWLPLFKGGNLWIGRKSTLRRHFAEKEARALKEQEGAS